MESNWSLSQIQLGQFLAELMSNLPVQPYQAQLGIGLKADSRAWQSGAQCALFGQRCMWDGLGSSQQTGPQTQRRGNSWGSYELQPRNSHWN